MTLVLKQSKKLNGDKMLIKVNLFLFCASNLICILHISLSGLGFLQDSHL